MNTFTVPMNCLHGVRDVFAGHYPLNFDLPKNPVIVDIGANVGAFSMMCRWRWPDATIAAFEPNYKVFKILESNFSGDEKFVAYNEAVVKNRGNYVFIPGHNDLTGQIAQGSSNCFCQVSYFQALNLYSADLIKIDVEGMEDEIIEGMILFPKYLIVEWHSWEIFNRICNRLHRKLDLKYKKVLGKSPNCWGVQLLVVRHETKTPSSPAANIIGIEGRIAPFY